MNWETMGVVAISITVFLIAAVRIFT